MAKPTCATCRDTHKMTLHVGFDEREVMCTHCPVPCQKCRAGGNGPYCERTPCRCDCHVPKLVGTDGTVIDGTREADGSVVFRGPVVFRGTRSVNAIADDLRLECMSWRAERWRGRMRELCCEFLAATEGGDGGG